MSKVNNRLKDEIIHDIKKTIAELWKNKLVRDGSDPSVKKVDKETYYISFSEKSSNNNILFDKNISVSRIFDSLLRNRQYTVLLYDKSIIQGEFTITDENIIKERLLFIKKHNKVWDKNEISEADNEEDDWFADDNGIPILFRIDYDPKNRVECNHPACHLTLSNVEECRIPIKDVITFSEFVRFVLYYFYNIRLNLQPYRKTTKYSITQEESKMIHINWE